MWSHLATVNPVLPLDYVQWLLLFIVSYYCWAFVCVGLCLFVCLFLKLWELKYLYIFIFNFVCYFGLKYSYKQYCTIKRQINAFALFPCSFYLE